MTTLFPATAGAPSASGDGDDGEDDEEAPFLLLPSFHSSSCLQALQTTPLKGFVEGRPLSSGVIGLPSVPVATITVEARSLLFSTTAATFSCPSTSAAASAAEAPPSLFLPIP